MSENKGAYQPWRHEAFLADRKVRKMTHTELKTYMLLLHEAFVCETRPNLPDDDDELEEMALCNSREEWLSVRDAILGMFEKATVGGKSVLTRKRLTEDWNKLQEIREARSEAGKASAAKRKSTSVEQMLTPVNTVQQVSKQVSNVSKEREEKEETENPLSLEDGQGEDMNLKPLKASMTMIAARYKAALGGYDTTWADIKLLADSYGSGALLSDFENFLKQKQGEDFPKGVAVAYQYAAPYRLAEEAAEAVADDSEVVSLTRELTYVSDGALSFVDKQKIRLAEVLKDFSAEEVISVFRTWLGDQDLSDPKNVSFLPGKFVQIVDSLCYSARRKKQEAVQDKTARDAAVVRLQAQAEEERAESEKKKQAEDSQFDPLA